MPSPDASTLTELRRALSTLGAPDPGFCPPEQRITFGSAALDEALQGGLPAGALHEIYAGEGNDGAVAFGFSLAMLLRAAAGRSLVFIRQDMAARELGELYPPGLAEFGAEPGSILSVQVKDAVEALRAGNEALRCPALGAVAIELWGKAKAVDLTATRRLARAAEKAGTTALLVRHAAEPVPSAALSRWRVRSTSSAPFIADAPGMSRFDIELLRHRAGLPPRRFCVEWDRDQSVFRTAAFQASALPRSVAAAPADRPTAPHQAPLRRAG
jgi:protein ImuA